MIQKRRGAGEAYGLVDGTSGSSDLEKTRQVACIEQYTEVLWDILRVSQRAELRRKDTLSNDNNDGLILILLWSHSSQPPMTYIVALNYSVSDGVTRQLLVWDPWIFLGNQQKIFQRTHSLVSHIPVRHIVPSPMLFMVYEQDKHADRHCGLGVSHVQWVTSALNSFWEFPTSCSLLKPQLIDVRRVWTIVSGDYLYTRRQD